MFSLFKKQPTLKSLIPADSVDIHSHVLPGIDDGAKSIEDTRLLLTHLKDIGFSKCIATPHTLPEVWENSAEGITSKFKETKVDLATDLSPMLAHAASEYMINDAFLERLHSEPLLTLKDNYLLIEMSYLNPPLALKEILFEIKSKGYQPLLAHPERYLFYHNQVKNYEVLKELDVQFQLNLLSTVGYYGSSVSKIANYLLQHNFIDFVGTDVHHLRHIKAFDATICIAAKNQLSAAIENNSFFK